MTKKPDIIIGGKDEPDPKMWPEQLRLILGIGQFPHHRCAAGRIFLRCLFVPSFSAECWIEIEELSEGAKVHFQTQQTNLYNWTCDQMMKANGKALPGDHTQPEPMPWSEIAEATPQQLDAFRSRIPVQVPKKADQMWAVLDGMQVHCEYHRANGQFDSFSSQGIDDPATFQLAEAVHWLAEQVLTAPTSRSTLQRIRLYFH